MLKLLLDEHVPPTVAAGLRRIQPRLVVFALREWQNGALLGRSDVDILRTAFSERLTLVTYDQKTIRPLLHAFAEEGQTHAGVIFVDEKTIAPSNVGGLVRALSKAAEDRLQQDWTGRTAFLEKVGVQKRAMDAS